MPKIRRKLTQTGAKPSRKTRKVILTDEQKAKRKEEDQKLAESLKNVTSYIIAPAGKPPYDLEGTDMQSIEDWVSKIKGTGNHTVQSCQYWVRYFYDMSNPDTKKQYKEVCAKILINHTELGIPNMARNFNKSLEEDED